MPAPDAYERESAAQEVSVAGPGGQAGSFVCSHDPGGGHGLGQGRHAQLVELRQRRSGLDDVELGVSADVGQAQLVDLPQQGPALA